ncbi:MAG: hypothetical protein QNJ00_15150 [Woeseiaceae bacterium]|nr:hypothetical protein [Woeseiaceae bacterium]
MTELPLVLVTVGNSQHEFEALYDHLETVSKAKTARFQSLIVARRDMPDVFYAVLRSKADSLPNVHMRRLGDGGEHCDSIRHAEGTFYTTRKPSFTVI